ncbi:MAG: hypothetical protein H6Q17_2578 [Bacteroidetes bacterium]|jgi:hypothetical protein|nr:hypothetical protein [Bacteroidota bacterium]
MRYPFRDFLTGENRLYRAIRKGMVPDAGISLLSAPDNG